MNQKKKTFEIKQISVKLKKQFDQKQSTQNKLVKLKYSFIVKKN